MENFNNGHKGQNQQYHINLKETIIDQNYTDEA